MKKEKRRWVITKKLKIIFICVCSVFLFLFFSFSKTHHFYVILCHFTKYLLFYHHLLCVSISFYSEFIIFFFIHFHFHNFKGNGKSFKTCIHYNDVDSGIIHNMKMTPWNWMLLKLKIHKSFEDDWNKTTMSILSIHIEIELWISFCVCCSNREKRNVFLFSSIYTP